MTFARSSWRTRVLLIFNLAVLNHAAIVRPLAQSSTHQESITCLTVSSEIDRKSHLDWPVTVSNLQANGSFTNIFFVNELTGWAFSQISVYRTVDGGNSWRRFKIGVPLGFCVTKSVFFNRRDGWVVLENDSYERSKKQVWVMRTANGGETWQQQMKEQYAFGGDIAFVNEMAAWFL